MLFDSTEDVWSLSLSVSCNLSSFLAPTILITSGMPRRQLSANERQARLRARNVANQESMSALRANHSSEQRAQLNAANQDLIIIDEISTFAPWHLARLDTLCKAATGNYEPSFGGIPVLLCGDLNQLGPVETLQT